jgi:hypothetical protein
MTGRKRIPEPAPEELEAAIVARIRRRGSIMNGMELQQFARCNDTTTEHARALLKKLGYELSYTIGGRGLWKKSNNRLLSPR